MKKIALLLAFICIGVYALCQAKRGQDRIDSLVQVLNSLQNVEDTNKVNTLNALARSMMAEFEYEKGVEYAKAAIPIAQRLNFKKGEANSYGILGGAYSRMSNFKESIEYYDLSIKLRTELGDLRGMAGSLHNSAQSFSNQGNFKEAINRYFKALKINEQINNKEWILGNYNNMALIYMGQEEYDQALDYLHKALKIADELGDRFEQNHPYNNIGNVYFEQGKYAEALVNYQKALDLRIEMGDQFEIGRSLNNVGICLEGLGDPDGALEKYAEGLKMASGVDDKEIQVALYGNIANVYIDKKKYGLAQIYLDSCWAVVNEIQDPEGLMNYYDSKTNLDSATHNFQGAFANYKMYVSYRDSILNDANTKQVIEQQMIYDFDKKEAATKAEQDIKDAIASRELQKQKLLRNGFIGGFSLVAIFAGVFFFQRNRIKKGKKLSDELLLNILPEEVAEELKAKGEADAKLIEHVTVLFTDFKGFTAMSEKLSPKELVRDIHECFSAFDNIIAKYGIEKIKTIGDAYMAAGGLPTPNNTHALDVVRAAIEIRQFIEEGKARKMALNQPYFEIRIGVHTGSVVAGIVGVKKFAYDIWGDTVNTASRMESSGEAGQINISESTYDLVKNTHGLTFQSRGKILAKGKGELEMYFVNGSTE